MWRVGHDGLRDGIRVVVRVEQNDSAVNPNVELMLLLVNLVSYKQTMIVGKNAQNESIMKAKTHCLRRKSAAPNQMMKSSLQDRSVPETAPRVNWTLERCGHSTIGFFWF